MIIIVIMIIIIIIIIIMIIIIIITIITSINVCLKMKSPRDDAYTSHFVFLLPVLVQR